MSQELLGWSAFLFFIVGCSYSLFKRVKSSRSIVNLSIKKLLEYHCIFCIIATILALIHGGSNLYNIKFSTGYVSLLLMVLVTLIGIVMKYFKKVYVKYRMFFLYTHIFLAIMLTGAILLHILTYLLLQ